MGHACINGGGIGGEGGGERGRGLRLLRFNISKIRSKKFPNVRR